MAVCRRPSTAHRFAFARPATQVHSAKTETATMEERTSALPVLVRLDTAEISANTVSPTKLLKSFLSCVYHAWSGSSRWSLRRHGVRHRHDQHCSCNSGQRPASLRRHPSRHRHSASILDRPLLPCHLQFYLLALSQSIRSHPRWWNLRTGRTRELRRHRYSPGSSGSPSTCQSG